MLAEAWPAQLRGLKAPRGPRHLTLHRQGYLTKAPKHQALLPNLEDSDENYLGRVPNVVARRRLRQPRYCSAPAELLVPARRIRHEGSICAGCGVVGSSEARCARVQKGPDVSKARVRAGVVARPCACLWLNTGAWTMSRVERRDKQ